MSIYQQQRRLMNQDLQYKIDSLLQAIKSYGVMFRVVDIGNRKISMPYIRNGFFKSYEAINEPYLKLIDESTMQIVMNENFHFEKPDRDKLYQEAIKSHSTKVKNIDLVVEHTYQSELIRIRRKSKDFTNSFLTIINEKLKELDELLQGQYNATS